jgi:hypothetical protein
MMPINWLEKIAYKAVHTAFADLWECNQQSIYCYMEIEKPVSAARELCILTLGARDNVLYLDRITTQNQARPRLNRC